MIKPYKFTICLVIILSSFFITNNSQAIPVRPFIELFEQIFKFSGKRADDIPLPDAGKRLEDFKGLGKTDDVIGTSETGKRFTDQIENFNLNKISELKNSTDSSLLQTHGVKHADRISDLIDLSEVNISDFFEENAAINTFRIFVWSGRVFRVSNNFNNPDANRIIVECRDNNEVFFFTALLEKKKKWLLLSENIKNVETSQLTLSEDNKSSKLNKQNLYVLTDIDEYIIFSTQTPENKKFPLHYFIISKEGRFYHFNNTYGTESPEYIIANASKKIIETKFTCKKV